MSTDNNNSPNQGSDENSGNKGRTRAVVWEYFEKITGDDGLPKTRCTNCNKVYSTPPRSGTSTMRRHLRKCCPQPITQLSPPSKFVPNTRSNEDVSEEVRAAKKLKSHMVNNIQTKTDRELVEFIWMNKRNVGLLEQKLPHKANAIKDAIKCYEDEIDRRANLNRPKDNEAVPVTSIVPVKIEVDDQVVSHDENVGENMAEDSSALLGENRKIHVDKTSPQVDNGKPFIKVEDVGDQSAVGNENCNGYITEEKRAKRLQIVAINGDENQASSQKTSMSALPQNICADLKEVSSVLSMLNSPNSFYTPQGNPLDQEAEMAKELLTELLKKDFETIVGSPDEQIVKSCIKILTKNLHKLPRFQGRVIETLNSKFESACQNWSTWHTSVQTNMTFEEQQGPNLEVLQVWQEKDMECELKIVEMDAEILRLKAELRKKEVTRESLVKQKSDLFDQNKISIDEAKKLLQDMVSAKLQSDVAIDNMKEVSSKWERIGEKFRSSEQV